MRNPISQRLLLAVQTLNYSYMLKGQSYFTLHGTTLTPRFESILSLIEDFYPGDG